MKSKLKLSFSELRDNHTLVIGETGVGKTFFSLGFIYYLYLKKVSDSEITILDFAPPSFIKNGQKIGGTFIEIANFLNDNLKNEDSLKKQEEFDEFINLLNDIIIPFGEILAPRSISSNSDQVIEASNLNFAITNELLHTYLDNPTEILIINDIGIHLHMGNVNILKKILKVTPTVLFNAYYGSTLLDDFGSNISSQEHNMLNILKKHMKPIHLDVGDNINNLKELETYF